MRHVLGLRKQKGSQVGPHKTWIKRDRHDFRHCNPNNGGSEISKISDTELRVIEREALVVEAQAIAFEVQGMQITNEQRQYLDRSPAYEENNFCDKAQAMREIAWKFRNLK